MLRYIKNPSIFGNILLQPYLDVFSTLHIIFRQIHGYLEPRLINVRHIEVYLPTFGYILADSGIFRIQARLDILMIYSEPMAYSGIIRNVDIFSQFQTLLKSNSCIFWTLFEQIRHV